MHWSYSSSCSPRRKILISGGKYSRFSGIKPSRFYKQKSMAKLFSSSSSQQDKDDEGISNERDGNGAVLRDYLGLIRPVTLIQAVGALIVGYLATISSSASIALTTSSRSELFSMGMKLVAASLSVYLSYGAGMAINDIVDSTTDAEHERKSERAIAAGRITRKNASYFTCALAAVSVISPLMAGCGIPYTTWTVSNLLLVTLYATGIQKVFLLKNIIVGWLGVSPLIGSSLLVMSTTAVAAANPQGPTTTAFTKLLRLAIIGFAVGVAREILKDMEDIDIDRIAGKSTLPLVVGDKASHTIAYILVGIACMLCYTPGYRSIFSGITAWRLPSSCSMWTTVVSVVKSIPYYMISTVVGTVMCFKASRLPLKKGEQLLKKSIYVLLAGIISGLILS